MKTYGQLCGVAKALDVVGNRWTLLIIRNLLLGGQRYKDLLDTLPGITTNLLAERLREMQTAGLVTTRRTTGLGVVSVYELTERGRELEPVVLALGRFGAPYLATPKRGDRRHVRWAMLSIKRRFEPERLTRPVRVQLSVDDRHHYAIRSEASELHVREGVLDEPDVRVQFEEAAFVGLSFGGVSLRTLLAKKEIAVAGDDEALTSLFAAVSGVRVS